MTKPEIQSVGIAVTELRLALQRAGVRADVVLEVTSENWAPIAAFGLGHGDELRLEAPNQPAIVRRIYSADVRRETGLGEAPYSLAAARGELRSARAAYDLLEGRIVALEKCAMASTPGIALTAGVRQ